MSGIPCALAGEVYPPLAAPKATRGWGEGEMILSSPPPYSSPIRDCVIIGGVVIPNAGEESGEESYRIDFIIVEDFSDSLEITTEIMTQPLKREEIFFKHLMPRSSAAG
jgi:hypothetical protein